MTNNNTHKGNDMIHEDFDVASWEDFEMTDSEVDEETNEDVIVHYDDYDEAGEDEDVEFEDDLDPFEETVNRLDDSRDLDFYES
jgi:hypothetical protein